MHEELADELAAMQRLHALSKRLIDGDSVEPLLGEILDAAIDLLGADNGLIQLHERDARAARIAVQRGLTPELVAQLEVALPPADTRGSAAQRPAPVRAEDALDGPPFAPLRERLAAAGFRGVQATPLITRGGALLGVLSTHYAEPREPTARSVRLLDLLARQAADCIDRTLTTEALHESDRRKDEFLATLAHELRNPLAPMRIALDLMRVSDDDRGVIARMRGVLERQAANLARLVDDLVDVSRITRGKIELRIERVELGEVIEAAIELSRPLIDQRKHTLTCELAADPLFVDGDRVRLTQVFANLLNNAAKYSPEGGAITLSSERDGDVALVRVRDRGIGIEAALLPNVFELFVQGSRTQAAGGLGVGLTLVRRVVELHGGQIGAASGGPGCGSEFAVRLPIVAREATTVPPRALAEAQRSKSRRVLVVDDNRDAAIVLSELLAALGHDVRTAFDGRDALQAASDFEPELVFLDLGLPPPDGLEVARRLRADASARRPYLVAVSGWGQPRDRERSADAGFDLHLVKPVALETIEQVLATVPAHSPG